MPDPHPDGVPLLVVHPDDVDLPTVKAYAAEAGMSVVVSRNVPRGRHIVLPQGVLTFDDWRHP